MEWLRLKNKEAICNYDDSYKFKLTIPESSCEDFGIFFGHTIPDTLLRNLPTLPIPSRFHRIFLGVGR